MRASVMPVWFRRVARVGFVVLLGGAGCTPTGLEVPSVCGAAAEGEPRLEIGTGRAEFLAVEPNGRWLVGYGQQGGYHLWLSVRTQGLGPEVKVAYEMTEPAGGARITGGEHDLCLTATGSGHESLGIQAFVPDSNGVAEYCSRVLCHGPFTFRVTVSDSSGRSVTDTREVPGVDEGDARDAVTALDCSDPGTECPEPLGG